MIYMAANGAVSVLFSSMYCTSLDCLVVSPFGTSEQFTVAWSGVDSGALPLCVCVLLGAGEKDDA